MSGGDGGGSVDWGGDLGGYTEEGEHDPVRCKTRIGCAERGERCGMKVGQEIGARDSDNRAAAAARGRRMKLHRRRLQ